MRPRPQLVVDGPQCAISRPEKKPIAAPNATAAAAPITMEARTAAKPWMKNHGRSGRTAPAENEKERHHRGLPGRGRRRQG